MAWRSSLSRSLISAARASTTRTSAPLPRLRPPPLAAPRLQPRRLSFANPRMRAIPNAAAQRGRRGSPYIAPGRQGAGLLRAVSWEERKRWVMHSSLGDVKAEQ